MAKRQALEAIMAENNRKIEEAQRKLVSRDRDLFSRATFQKNLLSPHFFLWQLVKAGLPLSRPTSGNVYQ